MRRLLSEEAIGSSSDEVMTQAHANGVPHKKPVICVLYDLSQLHNRSNLELLTRFA